MNQNFIRRYLVACLLGTVVASTPAGAAILRPITELHTPMIRLSDLFEGLAATPDRPLGPSPGPGGRVVVESAQLGAIARQFGVDWRPSSNADRAILERPGRMMPREAVQQAVRAALIAAGAGADCDIDLPGFLAPMVPIESAVTAIVAGMEYDPNTGRFAATLSVAGPGMEPVTSRIVGRADDMMEVPVATSRLAAGTLVQSGDLRLARVRSSLAHDVAETVDAAIGKELRHPAIAGQPLRRADLAPPALVLKGGTIQMTLENAGIMLIAQGQALESGGLGARLHVINTASRAMLEAEVTGIGQVRVRPESTPILPGGRAGGSDYRAPFYPAQLAGR